MTEELVSDYKRATESHHIQGSQQKRPYSVFRECQAGSSGGCSDGHVCKKIKGADHEATWNLSKRKAASYSNDELFYARRQHGVGFNGRNMRKAASHCGTVMRQRHDDHNKVVSSAHLYRHPSAAMLLLSCDDDDEEEVVRDGPGKGGKEKSTSSSSEDQPSGQPPSQHPDQPPDQAPNQTSTQSYAPQEPSGSNTQGEGASKQPPQFPDYSYQITRTRLMPFVQCSGSHELAEGSNMIANRNVVRCNSMAEWESSDSVDEHNQCGSSKQFCTALPESCSSRTGTQSNSQSDGLDGQYFKSPAQSQGSSSVQPSECFTFKDSQQETESNTFNFDTVYYPTSVGPNCYYRVGEIAQCMEPNNPAILGQDPPSLSAEAPSDHQSEVSFSPEESPQSARTHSGETTETDHLSPNHNQLPPTEDP